MESPARPTSSYIAINCNLGRYIPTTEHVAHASAALRTGPTGQLIILAGTACTMHAPRCLVGKPRGPPTRVLQRPTLTGLHAGRGTCAGTCAGRGRRRPRRTPPAWNPFPTPQPITLPQPCRPSACPAAHRRPPRGRLAGPRRRIWRRGRSTSERSSRPCPWPREVVEEGVGSACSEAPEEGVAGGAAGSSTKKRGSLRPAARRHKVSAQARAWVR